MSASAPLRLEAIQEIVVRPVIKGGDGVTRFSVHEAFVEFKSTPVDAGFPDEPVPDPCEETTVRFGGYEETADMAADGWTFVPNDFTSASFGIDKTAGENGGRAAVFSTPPVLSITLEL